MNSIYVHPDKELDALMLNIFDNVHTHDLPSVDAWFIVTNSDEKT